MRLPDWWDWASPRFPITAIAAIGIAAALFIASCGGDNQNAPSIDEKAPPPASRADTTLDPPSESPEAPATSAGPAYPPTDAAGGEPSTSTSESPPANAPSLTEAATSGLASLNLTALESTRFTLTAQVDLTESGLDLLGGLIQLDTISASGIADTGGDLDVDISIAGLPPISLILADGAIYTNLGTGWTEGGLSPLLGLLGLPTLDGLLDLGGFNHEAVSTVIDALVTTNSLAEFERIEDAEVQGLPVGHYRLTDPDITALTDEFPEVTLEIGPSVVELWVEEGSGHILQTVIQGQALRLASDNPADPGTKVDRFTLRASFDPATGFPVVTEIAAEGFSIGGDIPLAGDATIIVELTELNAPVDIQAPL